jgi:hypothetical protein
MYREYQTHFPGKHGHCTQVASASRFDRRYPSNCGLDAFPRLRGGPAPFLIPHDRWETLCDHHHLRRESHKRLLSGNGFFKWGRGMVSENKANDQESIAEASPVALGERATRLIELVSGAGCLTLLAPILIVAAIAVKLDSSGPIVVREPRCGHRNRRIEVYKFRLATARSRGRLGRLTLLAQFLRQTGIEDLPMLVNVIRGEMSIIGPPPSTYPTASLNERKPGVTRCEDLFSLQNRGDD